METILSANHLNVGYNSRTVISNVNIQALKGQVICLLGPNGAGKSTILRTLSGLLAPVSGGVQIADTDLDKLSKKDLARKLSLVLTDSVAPSLTTVYQLLSLGRTPYTNFLGRLTDSDRAIIEESLAIVGASHLKHRYYCELSDGEKQKVMIARALVQEPELIILDEPTSHLDIKHKVEVVRVLQKLSNERGITCILSLHDIDLALKGCQTVLLVHNGEVVAQGTPEDVVADGMIQQLYEIQGAKYNECFGSIELKGPERNDIFVIGGCCTGTRIYRALSRKGYGLTSGVLHRNDGDYPVAAGICQQVVSEQPFEQIGAEALAKAEALMEEASCLIDSGFPVGTGNKPNLELISKALQLGKPVFSARSPEQCAAYYGADAPKICCFQSMTELFEKLSSGR